MIIILLKVAINTITLKKMQSSIELQCPVPYWNNNYIKIHFCMIAMSMIKSLTAEIGIKHKICLSLEIEKCPKIGPRSDQTKHQFYNILFIFSGIQE